MNLNSLPNRSDKDDHIIIKMSNNLRANFPSDIASNAISITDTKQEKLAKLAKTIINAIKVNSSGGLKSGDNISELNNDSNYAVAENIAPQDSVITSGVATVAGINTNLHLTEDVYQMDFSNLNTSPGDSGLISITQDGNGAWTWFGGQNGEKYLAGDPADVASMDNANAPDEVITVGWFHAQTYTSGAFSGSNQYYFYISQIN